MTWKKKALITSGVILLALKGVIEGTERYPEIVPWLVELTAHESLVGYATKIRDGDTLEVDGRPIRLSSLDCAELGTQDGERAKNVLKSLSAGRTLTCHLKSRMSYDRHIGSCFFEDGSNVGEKLLNGGFCLRF